MIDCHWNMFCRRIRLQSYTAFAQHPFISVSDVQLRSIRLHVVTGGFHSGPCAFSNCGYHDHNFHVLFPSQKSYDDYKVSYHMAPTTPLTFIHLAALPVSSTPWHCGQFGMDQLHGSRLNASHKYKLYPEIALFTVRRPSRHWFV